MRGWRHANAFSYRKMLHLPMVGTSLLQYGRVVGFHSPRPNERGESNRYKYKPP